MKFVAGGEDGARGTSTSEYGGGAVWVGTSRRATDGVEDAHGVGQRAPRAVLHWVYLEGQLLRLGRVFKKRQTHSLGRVNVSLGTVGKLFGEVLLGVFSICLKLNI